jgi:hypothetical protein
MTKSRRDGLYLLVLGAAVFLLLGAALQHSASDSREDFKAVVYGARCLLHHCDPYSEPDLYRYYLREFGEPAASHLRSHTLTLYVNLPATIFVVSPFALLPFGAASALWSFLTAASIVLAAFLAFDLASDYSPVLSGALIALSLSSAAIVLGNLNPAGIVVAFSVIAVWCFMRQRFIAAGVLCLSISLAMKPHDAGLVWLCLLLFRNPSESGPASLRKCAAQTLAAATLLSLAGILWVSVASPHWPSEIRANMAAMSSPGGNNDPAPTGPTSRDRATEAIVSLQSVVSVFRGDPRFYNAVTYIVCGTLILFWLVATLRSSRSPALIWIALASIVPLTMLVTYHRAYDTRLLMLAVPACAMLHTERGMTGKLALLITTLGILCSGELPYAVLKLLTPNLIPPAGPAAALSQKLATLFLARPGSLALLLMALFYLGLYLSRALVPGASPLAGPPIPAPHRGDTMVTRT